MTSAAPWTDAQVNAYALTHIALPGLVLIAAVLLVERFVFTPKIRAGEEARARQDAARRAVKRAAQAAPFRRAISRGPALRARRRHAKREHVHAFTPQARTPATAYQAGGERGRAVKELDS